MAESATVIAALKFQGGVVIGSDSQVSDPLAGVRWKLEKLDQVGSVPLVIGFSGDLSLGQRARASLQNQIKHPGMIGNLEAARNAVEKCIYPIYRKGVEEKLPFNGSIWDLTIWALAALTSGRSGQIMEFGLNGVCTYHDYFHAIGSGSTTAYSIYRTLGGSKLTTLSEEQCIDVMLRILTTCIDVELQGVADPACLWIVKGNQVRRLAEDESAAHLQLVAQWIEREQSALFGT